MLMLSPWIEDASGHTIRVLADGNPDEPAHRVVQVQDNVPSVRIRADGAVHDDQLNWATGPSCADNKAWCDKMAKAFGYALPEEGLYVIQYEDGAFNLGAEGTPMNGFPANLDEASRYSTIAAARAKLDDLSTPACIVCVRDLDVFNPNQHKTP